MRKNRTVNYSRLNFPRKSLNACLQTINCTEEIETFTKIHLVQLKMIDLYYLIIHLNIIILRCLCKGL